jgi:hypothetical protein
MSSEFLANEEPRGSAGLAGAADPAGNRRASNRLRSWRSYVTAGVAVAALLGGTGVAGALGSATPANAAVTTTSEALSPSPSHPWPGHMGGGPGGWMLPLHGQFVIAKPGGGYQTLDFQRGSVMKVSTGSITVKSTDGFTQSYTITGSTVVTGQRDGISSVKTGDQAIVIATVSGTTATAFKIMDLTLMMHAHQQFGFGPGGQG